MDVLMYKESLEQELMLLDHILVTAKKMADTQVCKEIKSEIAGLRRLKQGQLDTVVDILSRGVER